MEEIKAAGGDAIAVGGDVGADDFPQRIIDATIKYVPYPYPPSSQVPFYPLRLQVSDSEFEFRKYGKLNHIVNNAGFTYDRMLHTTPDDAWDIIMKIHVRAPFRLVRAAAPYMRIKVSQNRCLGESHLSQTLPHPCNHLRYSLSFCFGVMRRRATKRTDLSSMYLQHQACTGTSVKPIMPPPNPPLSVSRRPSVKNGVSSAFAPTRSRLDTFRRGKQRARTRSCPSFHITERVAHEPIASFRSLLFLFHRLTAAKEAGATIEIDGKKVALGIPGGKSAATGGGSGGVVPGIPLGRGGTPDDAAGSILL